VYLRRFVAKKYKLPLTHECFADLTYFDLLTEVYEDYYDENPKAVLSDMKGDDGEIEFEETGDELIDKWEKELAMGLTPDLNEGLSPQAKQLLEADKKKSSHVQKAVAELDGLVDKFDVDPRYKHVTKPVADVPVFLGQRHK
jgi:hypothetical protein